MLMDDRLRVNARQKAYYETRFEAYRHGSTDIEGASLLTNLWWRARDRAAAIDEAIGSRAAILDLHKRWLGDLRGRTVLDLGCFSGNELSLYLADSAAAYRGVDLSEKAVRHLNQKLGFLGRADAFATATDILHNEFPDQFFDVVYAKSVLHHFSDLNAICGELERLLKPGGIIISDDPLQTEPLNRLARLIYRPFQTDREWEWPFTRRSVRILESHFEIVDVMGSRGLAKLALPFAMMPFGRRLAVALGRWGMKFDQAHARRPGLAFYGCWNATMLLRKRPAAQSSRG